MRQRHEPVGGLLADADEGQRQPEQHRGGTSGTATSRVRWTKSAVRSATTQVTELNQTSAGVESVTGRLPSTMSRQPCPMPARRARSVSGPGRTPR